MNSSKFFSSVSVLFLSLIFLLTSCRTPVQPEPDKEKQAALQEQLLLKELIRNRLREVHQLIEEKKFLQAEKKLIVLSGNKEHAQEIKYFQDVIDRNRELEKTGQKQSQSKAAMFQETEEGLLLPGNYRKVVTIDARLAPLEMPEGAMEKLLKNPITLNSSRPIGIKTLVSLLNKEGLNIVADEALQEDRKLLINVKNIPAPELFSYIARNMGVAFHIGENLVWVTEGESHKGVTLETRIIRLRQGFIPETPAGGGAASADKGPKLDLADAEGGTGAQAGDNDLQEALTTFMTASPEGSTFKIFPNRNIVMIRDTRENLRKMEEIIREFDKPPYQVIIEARFMEVNQDDLKDIGVNWKTMTGGKKAVGTDPVLSPNSKESINLNSVLTTLGAATEGGSFTLSGVLGDRAFDVILAALETKKSSVTLSMPRVTVLNNRQARLRKGMKYYYFEEYDVESIDSGDQKTDHVLVPSGSPTELLTGITFEVKVNVGNDGKTVLLGLKPELNQLNGWENYLTSGDGGDDDGGGSSSSSDDSGDGTALTQIKLPRVYEQTVSTSVAIQSGETVVLGGMVDNRKNTTITQVPLLGDLPLIGFLFRRKETTSVPINLLIFVTAHVVSERGEYLNVHEK